MVGDPFEGSEGARTGFPPSMEVALFSASVLFPTTDAGVVAQAAAIVLVAALGLWLARASTDASWFIAGLLVMSLALLGLRALH